MLQIQASGNQKRRQQGVISIIVSKDECVGHEAFSDLTLNLKKLIIINNFLRFL